MSEKLGEAPTPWGAPETTFPPGAAGGYFESGRPRLGGLQTPIAVDDGQAAVIRAVADTMIPRRDGWPDASAVDIVTFVGRYVTPTGYGNKHYPFAEEDAFKAGLDKLGSGFVDGGEKARTDAIQALEDAEDPLFEQLRALVYYGYYSRPAVTLAIRANVPAGKDYHGPPLPYGYLEFTEPWDDETLDAAGGGAGFVATEDVERVDLSKIGWLNGKGA